MLANTPPTPSSSGALNRDLHPPDTFLYELLDFIKNELPKWRDRADRPHETSEPKLTSHLCSHLNSATRLSNGWDVLQFKSEVPDNAKPGRTIDLAPAPSNAKIWIGGRSYVDFDYLMPIECKRLPTPKGDKRDEREYVISKFSSTGGIQRFKAGHHGANYKLGAMIGYIQNDSGVFWSKKVKEWLDELIKENQQGWSEKDFLQPESNDINLKLSTHRSCHEREGGLPEIELRHLWIEMN